MKRPIVKTWACTTTLSSNVNNRYQYTGRIVKKATNRMRLIYEDQELAKQRQEYPTGFFNYFSRFRDMPLVICCADGRVECWNMPATKLILEVKSIDNFDSTLNRFLLKLELKKGKKCYP